MAQSAIKAINIEAATNSLFNAQSIIYLCDEKWSVFASVMRLLQKLCVL